MNRQTIHESHIPEYVKEQVKTEGIHALTRWMDVQGYGKYVSIILQKKKHETSPNKLFDDLMEDKVLFALFSEMLSVGDRHYFCIDLYDIELIGDCE